MKRISIFTVILCALPLLHLRADVEADKKTLIVCEGRIAEFQEYAQHAELAGGGFMWSSITRIKLTRPKEWKDQDLEVMSQSLSNDHPLRKEGSTLRFTVAKIYLVGEYKRPDGQTDRYIPGDGSIVLERAH